MIEEFTKYVKTFDFNKPKIYLKYYHTLRVEALMKELAFSLGLNERDVSLASKIGLFHDYGRFNQATKYDTFSDINSIDHAVEGVRVLFEEHEIDKYNIDKEDLPVVKKSILNHNKFEIEPNLNERELLFAKMIRDADKLDILKLYIDSELTFSEMTKTISPEVIKIFNKEISIPRKILKTDYDVIVSTLAMLYDLNFDFSFKYLNENKIIEKLQMKYNDNVLKTYFNKIIKYIERRSKNA